MSLLLIEGKENICLVKRFNTGSLGHWTITRCLRQVECGEIEEVLLIPENTCKACMANFESEIRETQKFIKEKIS